MTLRELLSPEHIVLPLRGATLREVLDQMLQQGGAR